ncbi:MAG TPA: hypothetical protein VFS34_07450 [Thermoanaerobaculia bacterium]|nr:hypothetical protein [Thermoanaerobaculia bacterium]
MKRTLAVLFFALAGGVFASPESALPDAAALERMAARLTPTPMRVDISHLSPGDRRALVKIVAASRILNDVFLDQLWSGNRALASKLRADGSPLGRARYHYFWLNKGPWSEIDGYTAFLPNVPATKPPGANFYPEDMGKEEFESWVEKLSPAEQEEAKGFYTVIRRDAARKLTIVPYSREYRDDVSRAAALLRDAAAATDNATLRRFLTARAAAFLSNDYYESDIAWMDLDAPIDVTIGPYETYDDGLFGYKAAFESFVTIRDEKETARLAFFSKHLQDVEDHLPEDPKYRVAKLGAASPLRVVNEIFAAGDGNHGIATAAYNLPNDDRVVQQKGSKRILLRNIQQAKFEKTLVPISKLVLSPADRKDVDFDMFFTWILAHELTHGLGPHQIEVGGRETNPRFELKELYSAIEEAKADVTGMVALQRMMDTKAIPGGPGEEHKLYTTVLASAFRTLHFGLQDAHARGQAMQVNYLLDKGGYVARPDGTFAVDFEKIKQSVSDLDHDLLTLEATGDYAGAKKMMTELAVLRPGIVKTIDRLAGIPTDIEPIYTTAEALTSRPGAARKRPGGPAKPSPSPSR